MLEEDLKNGKIAFPLVSLTLGAFAGKTEDSQDLRFQPALIVGLFRPLEFWYWSKRQWAG